MPEPVSPAMQRVFDDLVDIQQAREVEIVLQVSTPMQMIHGVVSRVHEGLVYLKTDKEGQLHAVAIAHVVSVKYKVPESSNGNAGADHAGTVVSTPRIQP